MTGKKRRGPKIPAKVIKVDIPAAPPLPAKEEAKLPRLIDLGVNVDEEGRYKLRYSVDLPGIKKNVRGFIEKLAGASAGAIFDGLLGRKDDEDE